MLDEVSSSLFISDILFMLNATKDLATDVIFSSSD